MSIMKYFIHILLPKFVRKNFFNLPNGFIRLRRRTRARDITDPYINVKERDGTYHLVCSVYLCTTTMTLGAKSSLHRHSGKYITHAIVLCVLRVASAICKALLKMEKINKIPRRFSELWLFCFVKAVHFQFIKQPWIALNRVLAFSGGANTYSRNLWLSFSAIPLYVFFKYNSITLRLLCTL